MQLQSPSDQSLIQAVQIRDEGALKLLYDRYSPLVFSLALRRLGDRGLAEEVLQDVFVRCWDQAASYRVDAGSVPAWLFGITRNRTVDVRRSRQQHARDREQQPLAEDAPETEHDDFGETVALRISVRSALQELPPEQRRAIELAYYGDLSQTQIAARLGEPLGTVKTRMRAGMERLRRALQPAVQSDIPAGVETP